MNMDITLTSTELETLANMETQAKAHEIGFWQIYKWLGDLLQTKGVSATDATVLWLRGATEANAGHGAFSELIRSYTETQYQLRYGKSIPTGKMQEASDAVAQNLIDDLRGKNLSTWECAKCSLIGRCGRCCTADAQSIICSMTGFKGSSH
jgi:hypothetical protein